MKKIAIIGMALIAFGCQKKEDLLYHIRAETVGFSEGSKIYVNLVNRNNIGVAIDSATIENNVVEFKFANLRTDDFHFLSFENDDENVLFFAEKDPVRLVINKDSIRKPKIVEGPENKLFYSYMRTLEDLMAKRQELATELHQAKGKNDTATVNLNTKKMAEIEKQTKDFRITTATEKTNSLLSIMALTDLISLKILPGQKIKELFTAVDEKYRKSRLGENLNTQITEIISIVDMGDTVQDFEAPTPQGEMLSLKKAMGKITIVDFWASWCKPCRVENPNVVRIYNKYHDKGLNILGVSLDKSKDKWVAAIDQDKLTWNHISNLKFWKEPIAKTFGVRSIPATFILDENGKVVAKNLRGPQLENKIKELLGDL